MEDEDETAGLSSSGVGAPILKYKKLPQHLVQRCARRHQIFQFQLYPLHPTHQMRRLQVPDVCKRCDFVTTYFNHFVEHMKEVHPGVKQYRCTTCKAIFTALYRYKEHYNKCHKPASSVLEPHAPTNENCEADGGDYSTELFRLSVMTDKPRLSDLCRMLEGKHRSAKNVANAVVE